MSQLWEMIFQSEFLFSVIRITAPILFAALGAAIAERAGLTNMGLEGMMMISALFGTLTSYWTQSWIIGVLCALLVGLVLSLMVGFFALKLKTDIILAGIAVLVNNVLFGYLWSDTPSSAPVYNAAQDVSANGMYSRCKEKGKINTLPELPGVLVFMDGHVGVYIGNGYVIEARGFEYGVVKTKLKNRPWVNWGKCPFITYGSTNNPSDPSGSTTTTNNYFAKCSYTGVSIVDGLKSIKAESSYSYRSKIAKANGISNYSGTAAQNTKMLTLLKSGKLLKP